VFPTAAAPPGPRGNPGSTISAGTRADPVGRAKCAPSRNPSERSSSIGSEYPGPRDHRCAAFSCARPQGMGGDRSCAARR
jgi:hypothetical protein